MNIDALKTLIQVAKHRNFRAVADVLCVTQPAIAKRVKVLEEQIGAPLTYRVGKEMHLTSAGRHVLPYAERIVRIHEEMDRSFSLGSDWSGTLRLGVIDTIIATWLTEFLYVHRQKYPNVDFEVSSSPTHELLGELQAGKIDIGFMLGPSFDRPFTDVPLGPVEVGFYKGRDLKIEGYVPGKTLPPEIVTTLKIITFPRGAKPHQDLEEMIRVQPLIQRPTISNCVSVLTMRSMAERGLGVATLPVAVALDAELERLDLGFSLPPLHFAASYDTASATDVISDTCEIAQQVAISFDAKLQGGLRW